MDWHELEKMKVTDLREMAKEKTSLEGVVGMSKQHLVEALAKALDIPKPHKVAHGEEKAKIKKQIRDLRGKIAQAIEKKDHAMLKALRENAHGLRRKLRRHADVVH